MKSPSSYVHKAVESVSQNVTEIVLVNGTVISVWTHNRDGVRYLDVRVRGPMDVISFDHNKKRRSA